MTAPGAHPGPPDARPAAASVALERVRAREPDALEAFFDRHADTLYAVLYRLLGHREAAEDALEETFVRVYRALGSLNAGANPRRRLVTVAWNVCREGWRKQGVPQVREPLPRDLSTPDAGELPAGALHPAALHPAPVPGPAMRARLRAAFADGSILPGGPGLPAPRRPWPSGRAWASGLLWAAIAGLFFGVVRANRGPAWQASAARDVRLGHRAVPADSLLGGSISLRRGDRLDVGEGGELTLILPRRVVLEALPGTVFTVPGTPGRWFGRDCATDLARGDVRISTGPGFLGTRFHVLTPTARAEVTGTTLAVHYAADSTCVCVLEGHVRMSTRAGGASALVRAGTRRSVTGAEGAPRLEPLRDTERLTLRRLRDGARALWTESP